MAKLGLQIYSIRDDYAADYKAAIASVKEMGFDGVEFFGALESHTPEELREACEAVGLEICGYHTPYEALSDDRLCSTLDYMRRLGNKYIIVPWMPQMDSAGWQTVIDRFNAIAPTLRAEGFRFGFHLHKFDVAELDNGSFGWKMTGEQTPDDFIMQCDIGNCFGGGRDGVEVYEMFAQKSATFHAKPFKADGDQDLCIGTDDVDWHRVIARSKKENCEWVIIEIEKGQSIGSQTISDSAKYLRQIMDAE